MAQINLLTVCTDAYPLVYAEKLIRRLQQVSMLNIVPYCLTDRPDEVKGWATILPVPVKTHGWWNKVNLFSPDMPQGWNLYIDIDIVIAQNFDEEVLWTIRQDAEMAGVSDAIGWKGVKFNSSLMVFKTGSQTEIFKKFAHQAKKLEGREGGDQVWVGPQLKNVCYIDEKYPDLKRSLKFDIARREDNKFILPLSISSDIKLIDCGGQPKPHELSELSYIKDNWHDVPTSSAF